MPDEDDRADPGREESRQQDQRQHRAAEAGGLDDDHGADDGVAEDRRDRGEAPGRGHDGLIWSGAPLRTSDGQDREPAAERDEWRLGPRTTPRPMPATAARSTPGSWLGQSRRASRQSRPLGDARRAPASARSRRRSAHRRPRGSARPPQGDGAEPEGRREVQIGPLLYPLGHFEERRADQRDDDPDDRGEDAATTMYPWLRISAPGSIGGSAGAATGILASVSPAIGMSAP